MQKTKPRILEKMWNNASIITKILITFIIPITLILGINISVYVGVNRMIERIDEIYLSNVRLNELSESLGLLQSSVEEYLKNKTSKALTDYYRYDQEYRDIVAKISETTAKTPQGYMEQNIVNQSKKYLSVAGDTIQAKRGRNVEKYRKLYEEAEVLYGDLKTCIYSLNNEQFIRNTDNYYSLLSTFKYMEMISIIILVVIAFTNITVILILTRSLMAPLVRLSEAAGDVAEGNFDVVIDDTDAKDEISVMSKAFKQMTMRLQTYIQEIRASMRRESELKEHELMMENRMREVELINLQAQINPHFLFNTLNAGAQLAMMEGSDKTVEFIQTMADFFRYNIKKINMDATIGEEVALVDKYIYILNVRFTGEIHYEAKVDEDVTDVRIPSMILQPIVENAVNHGIRNISWEGHIALTITRDSEFVYISIKDNGAGMLKEDIEKILTGNASKIAKDHSDSNGVGMSNVIERLKIYTGRDDVLSINSDGPGKGTEFIVKLPLTKENGNV